MENQQPTGEAQNSQKKEWYKNWWGVIVAIIILPIFVIWYIWAKTQWSNKAKWIATAFVIIFSMGTIGSTGQDSTQTSNQKTTVSSPTQTQKAKDEALIVQQPEKKNIPYEVVLEWSINNGGKGERIVIDPKYLNFDNMTALGETLREDLKNERNAFVFVHTDKKSADLQGKMLENPTQSEMDYVGKHYVGSYTKNANSKMHEFTIFLNGIDDTSETTNKIITY
ncbi:MAG: hypothetical protein A2271_02380 [Candidatus Moranbacteria bacterium RIFOXYA12_FULL_35_19]|nr:MAG: hypothetical protein UR78_C0008G0024 [Candidatus Moranbacteria bacterium GW2011_GWF2_35_39]OGI31926.1 MAG: hypothetical protein A2343_00910 [Candidatus Moranbacteria bacterium RIFOXYB12_FULL_35_8]OGI35386.1 MAG: hypothetical protein A2271_02380 [Candidatus Moranbacteria bacterium RIFOXYA12_FULL_35_19]